MPRQAARRDGPALRPLAPEFFSDDHARHLLWRAGFGGTPRQVETLVGWGLEKSVDQLLAVEAIAYDRPADDFQADIMLPPGPAERQQLEQALARRDEDTVARFRARRQQSQADDRRQVQKMQRWWLARMIESPKPLEEKMTLFWHGHFATSYRTIENSWHMYMQNQLFRRHALGNYGKLLFSIIRDPAMLAYLDNNRSREEAPNENLAREIMELFSLGVGAYSEKDIKDGARALTGYTFEGNEFAFRNEWHDKGTKSVLGKTGNMDGDAFVTAILEQRACSEFIAWKLYRCFVADIPHDPRQAPAQARRVIGEMASAMRAARYEVKPVLRSLFLSEQFYAPEVMGGQIKSPAQLVVGAVRSLGAPVRDLGVLLDAMEMMGQDLLFPPSVAGWAGGRTWINTSTLFVRQNVLTFLIAGKTPGGYDPLAAAQRYDPSHLVKGLPADAARDPKLLCAHLLRTVLGPSPTPGGWPASDRIAPLVDFVRTQKDPTADSALIGLLSLITAMPEHQLC